VPAGKRLVLQIVHPPFLTGQDVDKLLPDRRLTESGNRLVTQVIWDGGDMAEQEVESLVHCTVQLRDSGFGEHGSRLRRRVRQLTKFAASP
jgi:hypothetical protein